jgi:hypothetical protein
MTARVWPLLVPATIFISLGALGVCMAFVSHGPLHPYAGVITLVGAAFMLAGLVLTIFIAKPVLAHDEYVAALESGLLVKLDGEERFFEWSGIAGVVWDAAAAGVVVTMREGAPLVMKKPFGRAKGVEVAQKLDDVRRKAAFSLL